MAEFKIRDKETGEVFTIREKEDRQVQQQQQQQPSAPQTEQRMQNRPSAMADLINNPTTMQHPLGAVLRTLAGAGELYQGWGSSIASDLQQGQPQNILSNLGKVTMGERPIQYGDVFQNAGLPEPVAAGAGLFTDTMLMPGGAKGTVELGKLVKNIPSIAKNGIGILKKIVGFENSMQRAQTAKQGLDTLRDTLGNAKQIALAEVKNLPAEFDWAGNVSQKVVNAIKNPVYQIEFDDVGGIKNTVGNLDKIKTALQDILTQKDYVEAGDMERRLIMQLAGKTRDAMVKATMKAGKPELAKSLKDYSEFMDNYRLINDHLVDKYGNAMANKLKSTFKLLAEPRIKEAWKTVAKNSPEVKSVMKSMNSREILKNLLVGTGAATLAGGSIKKVTTLISNK